ncbi:MAG TPA: serine/threonine-protein kinase [Gemmatimonadales bacterium]|nr:serine/threonine-protein kinase [Gemmatimonadales bacterium]
MPDSPTERYRRVDAVFDALLDLPPSEQLAYAERAAGGDAEVHAEVLRLLHAHRREGFLESPLPLADQLHAAVAGEPPVPERVGPWRIERLLGRGGMGAVYLGRRADGQFDQRAAVKLIQRHAPGVLRRFLEERRILALLEHPGIARLLEGGVTPDGMPYFAMELVDGVPLTRYCDEHDLPVPRRLELVAQVCDAVSYAHQHLVIHRDLKPSNILVTADGSPKLLDFGVAKLLAAAGGAELTETHLPAMTPEFAAPEQVRGEAVSTATDVYALGVVLFLLLTDGYPYDVRGKSFAELAWIIAEAEPPRPSAAAPPGRRRELAGDLDLIVLTALRKDPARRYQTPAELAGDLRRYRDGRPIRARADSAGYRLAKFAGRNRVALAAVAAVLALLAGGLARERSLRHRAELEAQKAREVGDWVVSVFDVADPMNPERRDSGEVTARALLERGARRVDSSLADQPEVQAQLRGVFGRAYTNLGLYDQAIPMLQRALAQHTALYGPRSLPVADDRGRLGEVLMHLDRYDEAEPHLRAALDIRRARLGERDDATAEAMDRLATSYQRQNKYPEAEPLFRQALAIRRGLFGDTAVATATSLNNLGVLLILKDRPAEAEAAYREALGILLKSLGERHARTAETQQNLAQALRQQGHDDEAERLYRQSLATKRLVLGNANPSVTIGLNNLAELLMNTGRLDEAESLVREALVLDRRMFGNRHSFVAEGLSHLGWILRQKGEFAESEQVYRQGLAIDRERLGPVHRSIAIGLNSVGNILRLRGDIRGAEAYYREAVDQARRSMGDDHLNTIACGINLARTLVDEGRPAEAEAILRPAIAKLDTAQADHRPWWIGARVGLALTLLRQGKPTEARDLVMPVVPFAERVVGPDHVRTSDARMALGQALTATGEYAQAEPLLRSAAAWFDRQRKVQPVLAAQSDAALADLRRRRGAASAGARPGT